MTSLHFSNSSDVIFYKQPFILLSHKVKTNKENLTLLESLPFYDKYTTYRASDVVNSKPSPSVRDLGIIVDECLNWKTRFGSIKLPKSPNNCVP